MNTHIRTKALLLAAVIGFFCASGAAFAHTVSNSYLTLGAYPGTASRFHGQWDISLRDLNFVLNVDSNGDGQITWGELKAHQKQINDYAYKRLRFSTGGHDCPIKPQKQWVDTHADGAYAVLFFDVDCPSGKLKSLKLEDSLLFKLDPTHRGILVFRDGANTSTALLSPTNHSIDIKLTAKK
ncbi:MAG: hypothetical protein ACRESR_04410 [Gammaproteobacteria bacterium]